MVTLAQLFESYKRKIRNLDESEDFDEFVQDVLLVLSTRNAFENYVLTGKEQRRLDLLDDELVKHWEKLGEVLPLPAPSDRRRWWWFLHEGPQVREQARALAAD